MKIILFANTDWYLYHYRLPLAEAMRAAGHHVILMSPGGDYSHLLLENHFRWIEFPLSRRGKNPLVELDTIRRLLSIYLQEKPDGVQHFTIKCAIYGSIAARIAGIGTIVNAVPGLGHVFIDTDPGAELLRWFVKNLYRLALRNTKVIFQNPDDQQLFIREKIIEPEQQVLIKGSGIDLQQFSPAPEAEGNPLVILAARMLWAKGIQEFVDAAALLKAKGSQARFVLVGDSDPNTAGSVPRSQLQAWHEAGVIEWWGWQEDILKIIQQAHIVCLPTYYGEGVPRSLVEAAACAKPMVAADMPGSREIIKQGENGYLVNARDSRDLADHLQKLLDDPELRRKMGRRSREIAVAEFSVDSTIARNLQLFKTMPG